MYIVHVHTVYPCISMGWCIRECPFLRAHFTSELSTELKITPQKSSFSHSHIHVHVHVHVRVHVHVHVHVYMCPLGLFLVSCILCTVEPLNNGHIGIDHFVHYREVVLFQRQNVYKYKNEVGCRDDTVPKTVDTRRHCEEE